MRSQLGLAFCILFCVSACGGNADLTQPFEPAGVAGAGASTNVTIASAAGGNGTAAGGAEATAAGGTSAGAAAGAAGESTSASGGEAGAAPIDTNSCSDAPAVVGCGCPMNPNPPPEVWSCIECDTLPSASALIGAEGGSFTLRGEGDRMFVLTIPPNALTAPTMIRVAESVRPPVGLMPVSTGYSIEPKGIEFAVPVSVTIPVAANVQATGFYWSPDVCSEPAFLLKDATVPPNSVAGTITRSGVVFASAHATLP